MPGSRHLANDAWEALLSAHAVLMKELAAEDIWAGLPITVAKGQITVNLPPRDAAVVALR
jgi:hypothetical protein